MSRFKVFLRSGTVITIIADKWWDSPNGFLSLYRDDVVIAMFAPDMWEGIQDLCPVEPKKAEESGS